MKLMQFGKKHKTGIKKIDDEHKKIIDTINHIYEIQDQKKQEILESLNQLLAQLKFHFEYEEKLMKENKVVHFISHKLEHDRALLKYKDYYNTFKSGKNKFDSSILISLKNWLESHLEKKDMKLQNLLSKN